VSHESGWKGSERILSGTEVNAGVLIPVLFEGLDDRLFNAVVALILCLRDALKADEVWSINMKDALPSCGARVTFTVKIPTTSALVNGVFHERYNTPAGL
jgi:hypothetical protein